jgi:hypothetical protein
MSLVPWQFRGYNPGVIAIGSIVVAGACYFASLWYSAMSGSDLAQGAFLHILVPFIFAIPAWLVGNIVYFAARGRQRAGDVAFGVVLLGECLFVALSANAG